MLLFASAAFAADPAFSDLGLLLRAPASGPFMGGINAPTVAWDGSQYVMFFESPTPAADVPSDCGTGNVIGRATSPDGVTWTIDETPAIAPDHDHATSVYSCSTSQPAVVFDGTTWHLFFAMADEKQDSSSANNRAAGIGYATSTDGVTFTVQEAPVPLGDTSDDGDTEWHAPDGGAWSLSDGMPSATIVNRTIFLVYMQSTSIYAAKYDLDTQEWSLWDAALTDPWTGSSWAAAGIFSPALYCDQDSETFRVLTGGYVDTTYLVRAAGIASSPDLTTWTVGDALASETVPFTGLNHLEVLPAGADLLLFYSMADPETGLKAVGLGTTSATWGEPSGRVCAWEFPVEDPGETGETGDADTDTDTDTDTDSDSDTDTDTDEDTGLTDDEGGCNCDSGGGSGSLVGLLALGIVVGRRRRAG